MTTFNKMKIILAAFVMALFSILLSKSKIEPNITNKPIAKSKGQKAKDTPKPITKEFTQTKSVSRIKMFMQDHISRLGKVDAAPQKTEQEIISTANKLTDTDIIYLKNHAINRQNSNDSRFLAIYLLGQSNNSASADSLKSISVTPISTDITDKRLLTDELIIRAQAIEFIGKKWGVEQKRQLLHEILIRNNNTFIANWARKTLTQSPQ